MFRRGIPYGSDMGGSNAPFFSFAEKQSLYQAALPTFVKSLAAFRDIAGKLFEVAAVVR